MNDTKPQDNTPKIAMPVCPFCKEEMVLTSYQGYYDSFCYWGCDCDAKVNLKTDSLWITGLIGYFPVTIGGNNG